MDRRGDALIGSFVFFWVAPAMVAGYVPWLLTRWRVEAPLLGVAAGRPRGYANATAFAAFAMIAATAFGWTHRRRDRPWAARYREQLWSFCRANRENVAARVQASPEAVDRRIRCCSLR